MKETITVQQLIQFLKNKRIKLSCGHHFCLHNFSNTMIIRTDGTIVCHNCGY